jgi:hypothetical protein
MCVLRIDNDNFMHRHMLIYMYICSLACSDGVK